MNATNDLGDIMRYCEEMTSLYIELELQQSILAEENESLKNEMRAMVEDKKTSSQKIDMYVKKEQMEVHNGTTDARKILEELNKLDEGTTATSTTNNTTTNTINTIRDQ